MATFGWQTHISEEPFKISSSSAKKGRPGAPKSSLPTPSALRSKVSPSSSIPRSEPQSNQPSVADIRAGLGRDRPTKSIAPKTRPAQSRLEPAAEVQTADHRLRRTERSIDAHAPAAKGPSALLRSNTKITPSTKPREEELRPSSKGRARSKSNPKAILPRQQFDAFTLPSSMPQKLDTTDLPPPNPTFSANSNSSRSTHQSEVSDLYSGTSTPTSMSSASPQLSMQSTRSLVRPSSPVRRLVPPTIRSRSSSATKPPSSSHSSTGQGLQTLREASNSSSSGSTVKASEKNYGTGIEVLSRPATADPEKSVPGGGSIPRRLATPNSESFPTNFSRPTPHSTPSPAPQSLSPPPRVPSRPSRPRDLGLEAPSRPIIHSNVPSVMSRMPTHRRKSSNTTAATASTTSLVPSSTAPSIPPSVKSIPSRLPSRNPSPVPSNASSVVSQTSIPSLIDRKAPADKSTSSSRSIRGFFGKKPPTPVMPHEGKPIKLKKAARGPSAGTGHEAYSRGTLRERSGTVTSGQSSRPRRSSSSSRPDMAGSKAGSVQASPKSGFSEFIDARQSPVYLRGQGDREATQSALQLSQVTSAGSLMSQQSVGDLTAPRTGFVLRPPFLHTQSENSTTSTGTAVPRSTTPLVNQTNLAVRRSQHRSQIMDQAPAPIPTPIKTSIPVTSPSLNSRGTTNSSAMPTTGNSAAHSYFEWDDQPKKLTKERKQRKPSKTEKVEKPDSEEKSSKGLRSFFSRAKHKYGKTPTSEDFPDEELSIGGGNYYPHYALPGSEHNRFEDQLRPSFERADHSYVSQEDPTAEYSTMVDQHQLALSAMRGSPASYNTQFSPPNEYVSFPGPQLQEDEYVLASGTTLTRKPSRLQQIGRIPQVVSTAGRATPKDSIFARTEKVEILSQDDERLQVPQPRYNKAMSDTSQPETEFEDDISVVRGPNAGHRLGGPNLGHDLPLPGRRRFARKLSSAGCSSNGDEFVAITPEPDAPMREDEVWPEFDGLLSYVSPRSGMSKASSREMLRPPPEYPVVADIANRWRGQDTIEGRRPSPARTPEVHSPGPETTSFYTATYEQEQQQPQNLRSLREQETFSAVYAGFGEDNRPAPVAPGLPSPSIYSQSEVSRPVSTASAMTGRPTSTHKRPKSGSRPAAGGESHGLSTEVRLATLTASKWLTYGKTLFSPALGDIRAAAKHAEQRVLVIDGLGTGDWSLFSVGQCGGATICALEPGRKAPVNPPKGYSHFDELTPAGKFPFPSGYFAAVVYRFPLVTSEAQYKIVIGECKRVLRPGGFIEVSLIDIDMTNMGKGMAKALRALKTEMHLRDPDLSLSPQSDSIKSLLKKRGFENVKSATLRPPVAGSISVPSSARTSPDKERGEAEKKAEDVSKMIPAVCRWWYTRCYERAAYETEGPDGVTLWDDEGLVRECEGLGTNFHLLVAYAQKPGRADDRKRRTISV